MEPPPLSPAAPLEEQLASRQSEDRPPQRPQRRPEEAPWRRNARASGNPARSSRADMDAQYDALGVGALHHVEAANDMAAAIGADPFGGVIPDQPAVRFEPPAHMQWRIRDDELAPGTVRSRMFDQPTYNLEGDQIAGERIDEHCYMCSIAATTATEYTARINAIWDGGLETIAINQLCRCIATYYDQHIKPFTEAKLEWSPTTVFTHFTRHVISDRTIHALNTRDLTVLLDDAMKRCRPVDSTGNTLPLSQDTIRTIASLLGLQSRELSLLDKKRQQR